MSPTRSRRCATSAIGCASAMGSRLSRGGLRVQLAVAIALVTALGIGISFLALYRGTSSRLQAQIDAQLRTQRAEWHQIARGSAASTPLTLARTARRFIAGQ